jgi:hypothetical protein
MLVLMLMDISLIWVGTQPISIAGKNAAIFFNYLKYYNFTVKRRLV